MLLSLSTRNGAAPASRGQSTSPSAPPPPSASASASSSSSSSAGSTPGAALTSSNGKPATPASTETRSRIALPATAVELGNIRLLLVKTESAQQAFATSTAQTAQAHSALRAGQQEQTPEFWNQLQQLYATNVAKSAAQLQTLRDVQSRLRAVIDVKRNRIRETQLAALHSADVGKRTKRRSSVINSIVGYLPTWRGSSSVLPPRVGCVAPDIAYRVPNGEQVAAYNAAVEEPDDRWILATVVNSDSQQYEVEDIVEDVNVDTSQTRHWLPAKCIVALPTWQPEPHRHEAFISKGTHVMALYPQTTCFYPAVVFSPPTETRRDYLLNFSDDEDVDGTTPEREVSVKFVLSARPPPV
ncbi:hypothetical protein CAOG_00906 [Capsaspora owczarzaki ATCC 30864]|uniref:SGF29 C-terminal domain-containing protein n=1 Tax=Capsaspora owczarzaki (strain ATCC 30864) TaxID=595528 RepID=A0A0D2WI33_CAPO3|nr:hypothetical protein CAOG_00906 [Capsaspora owczarzaki ATCC 30864]KJE89440.1 hypothetical protein CAOG_000906 [Capsaspora owczarzaki ATCC 30864]|eukprot:XP_004365777.2 hypothetical protein CAOG_00906 [Capsaspora owczarzaki ATCC 30864]